MRPRDILFFISYSIEKSIGKNHITQEALFKAEERYSRDRLKALEDEWKNPYLDMGKIFTFFRFCKYKLEKDEFMSIVEKITLDVLEKNEAKEIGNWSWIIENSYIDKKNLGFIKDYTSFISSGICNGPQKPTAG